MFTSYVCSTLYYLWGRIYVRNCAHRCWLPSALPLSSHAQIHNTIDGAGRCTSCSVNTRCELCMCRRVGHLSQVATADCGSLGSSVWNVRGCALRLLVLEWYFVQTMHILQITTTLPVLHLFTEIQKLSTHHFLNCQKRWYPWLGFLQQCRYIPIWSHKTLLFIKKHVSWQKQFIFTYRVS